jgi:hypothetical protein
MVGVPPEHDDLRAAAGALMTRPLSESMLFDDTHGIAQTRAGFTNVAVDTRKNGWIRATGRRPLAGGA